MTRSAGPVLKRLHSEFGDRIAFVTLYVREAHPGERYPQPASFAHKLAHARAYQQRDGIPWPVAIDDVEGALHRALGGLPSAAYLVGTGGKVLWRGLWSNDARAVRHALAAAAREPDRTIGQSEAKAAALVRGMGDMDQVLASAGEDAREDMLRGVPPIYLLGRVASLFRPLPALGRGIAAIATTAVALGAVVGGSIWLARRRRG